MAYHTVQSSGLEMVPSGTTSPPSSVQPATGGTHTLPEQLSISQHIRVVIEQGSSSLQLWGHDPDTEVRGSSVEGAGQICVAGGMG